MRGGVNGHKNIGNKYNKISNKNKTRFLFILFEIIKVIFPDINIIFTK